MNCKKTLQTQTLSDIYMVCFSATEGKHLDITTNKNNPLLTTAFITDQEQTTCRCVTEETKIFLAEETM